MVSMTRRKFIQTTAAVASTFAISDTWHRVLGANETIRVGIAGIHGRGNSHINAFLEMPGVEIAYLIDPDASLFESRVKEIVDKGGRPPKCVQDVREALDDKNLDAISIATCNHWHCLMTIWACQAGKDVYVEKPLSHNVREGRVAVEAAKRYNRVVQYGTGQGALGDRIAAIVKKGTYGKLLVSRGLCYKRRDSIGFKEPSTPPSYLDFDLWTGPAPKQAYHANLVHYNWHWFWDFGNGDIGNQGSHQMHAALHAIPGATLPRFVVSLGGRFGYRDQGQTANTQVAMFDFGDTLLIFEVRGLQTKDYYGEGIGNTFHFEEGIVAGDKFYPNNGKGPEPVAWVEPERMSKGGNFKEFVKCMRTRDKELFDWDLELAHYSSALCHLANISYRLGEQVQFASKARPFGPHEAANEAFERMCDHLKDNGITLEGTEYRLGRALQFSAKWERFIDRQANMLLSRPARPPFVVPEKLI